MTNDENLLHSLIPLKPVDFLLLAVLQDGPRHGYGLAQEMADRSDGRILVRPGDLYRVLYRLEGQTLVEGEEPAGPRERRRTVYRLTQLGQRVLRAEARRVAALAGEVLQSPRKAPETP